MSDAGINNVDGFPLPRWSPADSLAMMGRQHIAAAMLSISAPGLSFTTGAAAAALARAVNEENAQITTAHPARFGSFAQLPLPDIDAALAELAYALDTLKLDGVGLYSNYAGRYLGNEFFAPLFEELNRRRAVIFVHPTHPPGFERLSLGFPAPMLEYPFENTRMVCNLVATGQLRACPGIPLSSRMAAARYPI